jgi:hypothetical protein
MERLQFSGKLAALAAALLLAGSVCAQAGASTNSGPARSKNSTAGTTSDPPPNVQDCTNITVSTPTLYACNGKVYSAYKLTQLREARARKRTQKPN